MTPSRTSLVLWDDIPKTLGARKPRRDELAAEQRAVEQRLNVQRRTATPGILIDQQGRLVTDIVGNNGCENASDRTAQHRATVSMQKYPWWESSLRGLLAS